MSSPQSPNFQSSSQTNFAASDELWANERQLQNYSADLAKIMAAALPKTGRILEFGAGIATLANLFHLQSQLKPACVEIDASLRATIIERGFICYDSLSAIDAQFDGIYTSNVLEHIEDDLLALNQLHAALRPGGVLAVYVPAFMSIYTELDTHAGHFRRYSKSELLEKLGDANFHVLRCEYVDCLGYFAWLSVRLTGYSGTAKLGASNKMAIYDRYIYPFSRLLDAIGFKYLFGKNILVVAVRNKENN